MQSSYSIALNVPILGTSRNIYPRAAFMTICIVKCTEITMRLTRVVNGDRLVETLDWLTL